MNDDAIVENDPQIKTCKAEITLTQDRIKKLQERVVLLRDKRVARLAQMELRHRSGLAGRPPSAYLRDDIKKAKQEIEAAKERLDVLKLKLEKLPPLIKQQHAARKEANALVAEWADLLYEAVPKLHELGVIMGKVAGVQLGIDGICDAAGIRSPLRPGENLDLALSGRLNRAELNFASDYLWRALLPPARKLAHLGLAPLRPHPLAKEIQAAETKKDEQHERDWARTVEQAKRRDQEGEFKTTKAGRKVCKALVEADRDLKFCLREHGVNTKETRKARKQQQEAQNLYDNALQAYRKAQAIKSKKAKEAKRAAKKAKRQELQGQIADAEKKQTAKRRRTRRSKPEPAASASSNSTDKNK